MSSVSGLSEAHREEARRLAMQAAQLGLRNKDAVHYTQGARRWQGIEKGLKAYRGEFPKYADCSAFATWCLWNGLSHFGVRDVVNGADWRGGYTGTMLHHGKRVAHRDNVLRGDLVIYGQPGSEGAHVAFCVGGGLAISHGSEAAPFLVGIDYRPDVLEIRRYI